MTDASGDAAGAPLAGARRLPVGWWVAAVVVYLVVLQGLGQLLTRGLDTSYAAPTDVDQIWRMITLPVGLSVVLVAGLVTYLRWWPPVTVDDRPVQRWVVVVPVLMVLCIVAVTNYGNLAAKGAAFTALLLVSALLVGSGEELMFRGVGVTVFRSAGFTEGKVALWVTVVFGLAHATNLITEGPAAFAQVVSTIVAGYFFYLIRRRSGGIWVPILVHGLWDFSLISNLVQPPTVDPRAGLALPVMIILAVVVFVRRHHLEPATAPAAA